MPVLDRGQERLHADDVHDAREIVGEHVQGHLGRNLRQTLHQKVRRAHPHLERAERMLDCLTALAHCLRVRIETLLHSFEQVFVLPSRNARSEEHTSELQSRFELVCRLLLEKKKTNWIIPSYSSTNKNASTTER